jgi:hypothetical protein
MDCGVNSQVLNYESAKLCRTGAVECNFTLPTASIQQMYSASSKRILPLANVPQEPEGASMRSILQTTKPCHHTRSAANSPYNSYQNTEIFGLLDYQYRPTGLCARLKTPKSRSISSPPLNFSPHKRHISVHLYLKL